MRFDNGPGATAEAEDTREYLDESGKVAFRHEQGPSGDPIYRRPQKDGSWGSIKGCRLVPYRLPDILEPDRSETVFVVLDEAEADHLASLGLVATCCPQTSYWLDSDLSPHVEGRHVAIVGRDDDVGRERSEALAREIAGSVASVRIVELPGLKPRMSLVGWFERGWAVDVEEGDPCLVILRSVTEATPPYVPPGPDVECGPGDDDEPEGEVLDRWPKIDRNAFHGIAGEIVWMADPHSEADPIATLIQFLVAFGNMIGRGPHFVVGATRHYTNFFAALVGPTAVGRKGTSWDVVKYLMCAFDDEWVLRRIQAGLVSGEGLIHHVRDERTEEREVKAPSAPVNGHANGNGKKKAYGRLPADGGRRETVVVDPGVEDKRLLVIETELSRPLKAMNRESNTLSDVLRQAWESGDLRTLGKNNPNTATGAHISVIAHATQADVKRHLTETESVNGFANRFLWTSVRRSKMLPDGGNLFDVDWAPVHKKMAKIVPFARACGTMKRDAGAAKMWRGVYGQLAAGRVGLLGAVLSRAEAQAMRLACLYALLDGSSFVKAVHLKAALALWDYCEQSARFVFGEALGDRDAEALLKALGDQPGGLTRWQITTDVFHGHKKRGPLDALLSDLLTNGMVHRRKEAGRGRPAERWLLGSGGENGAK